MGINKNATRMGMVINNSLSIPVKKAIREAPGNNISHPNRHKPNDHGHILLNTLWSFTGSLLQVLSGESLFIPMRTAIIPVRGGPKPPPVSSMRISRVKRRIFDFQPGLDIIISTRKMHEKIIASNPVIK